MAKFFKINSPYFPCMDHQNAANKFGFSTLAFQMLKKDRLFFR
jgi:hypothetical protein